jgi:hypothetical protein
MFINPRFGKLNTSFRTAVENSEGNLENEATPKFLLQKQKQGRRCLQLFGELEDDLNH